MGASSGTNLSNNTVRLAQATDGMVTLRSSRRTFADSAIILQTGRIVMRVSSQQSSRCAKGMSRRLIASLKFLAGRPCLSSGLSNPRLKITNDPRKRVPGRAEEISAGPFGIGR